MRRSQHRKHHLRARSSHTRPASRRSSRGPRRCGQERMPPFPHQGVGGMPGHSGSSLWARSRQRRSIACSLARSDCSPKRQQGGHVDTARRRILPSARASRRGSWFSGPLASCSTTAGICWKDWCDGTGRYRIGQRIEQLGVDAGSHADGQQRNAHPSQRGQEQAVVRAGFRLLAVADQEDVLIGGIDRLEGPRRLGQPARMFSCRRPRSARFRTSPVRGP